MAKKPSLTGKKITGIKPEKARKLIRKFHVLLKAQVTAKAEGNTSRHSEIQTEIDKLGGLHTYQLASISGQSRQRGGDSSKVLVQWLASSPKTSLLEVGCLKVDNECARSKMFEPHVRIDLNSQHPQILRQDFMTMSETRKFGVISLSLVVNYVPHSNIRGKMLLKAWRMLEPDGKLFFVLPRACVDNSRYCNLEVISAITRRVGFTETETQKTSKLVYWLFSKTDPVNTKNISKHKVRDGPNMNNFSITISGVHEFEEDVGCSSYKNEPM